MITEVWFLWLGACTNSLDSWFLACGKNFDWGVFEPGGKTNNNINLGEGGGGQARGIYNFLLPPLTGSRLSVNGHLRVCVITNSLGH